MNKIKVGVTGVGSLIGQAIIKSILHSRFREKISIIGFDYFDDTVGSLWVEKIYLLPDCLKIDVKTEDWLEKIIEYINQEKITFLFIGLDFELKLFAKYKRIIESITPCKILVSDSRVIEIADDKYLTYKFLKENNLDYPRTSLPGELNERDLILPCILKPRVGCRSCDVFNIKTIEELKARLPQINNPIIQESIGSPNDEFTCGVIYLDSDIRGMIALKRKLKDGNTVIASFDKDTPKIIYDYISEITIKLKPFGICNLQLRLDDKGLPKVFEINARHSGTTYIRALFGFNEVEYILAYFLGLEIEKFYLKEGIVKRYYDEIFIGKKV